MSDNPTYSSYTSTGDNGALDEDSLPREVTALLDAANERSDHAPHVWTTRYGYLIATHQAIIHATYRRDDSSDRETAHGLKSVTTVAVANVTQLTLNRAIDAISILTAGIQPNDAFRVYPDLPDLEDTEDSEDSDAGAKVDAYVFDVYSTLLTLLPA